MQYGSDSDDSLSIVWQEERQKDALLQTSRNPTRARC